ncbi:hypothetical protein OG698_12015 [Streptomyces sp. NBC_01003]|uniref:hypothetical protein n=1 Tax=Streptomyces sp. NBC_01003 TaxID=2903714 RepID=UPI00386D81F2|nr:hypothetical protein OG698_12015 [Streptomyces sp. NBC_01003]
MTGLLRGPWGVLLVLANMLNAYVAYGALVTRPQGVWDERTLTGIAFASVLLIALGTLTLLATLLAVWRQSLGRWWLAPPLGFLVVGVARWSYIAIGFPPGAGG